MRTTPGTRNLEIHAKTVKINFKKNQTKQQQQNKLTAIK